MPVSNFDGETFVAFMDISGFKELMKKDNRAWEALNSFYSLGYMVLGDRTTNIVSSKVEGIFVSDCGILFVNSNGTAIEKLNLLLKKVMEINKGMLSRDFMLTTSIAYGHFKYQNRIEFEGIEKNAVYGGAYLDAYADAEIGNPHIQPGQCRIVKNKLPQEVVTEIETARDGIFEKIEKEREHYYFYWNVSRKTEIEDFKSNYRDSYRLKYQGMLKALKGN
ncbi:MAG: hypothetical protein A4E71_00528 [Smithella sp. PtaU1.Bin162]|nr:MAG: hypothetical protein A4E71_00528 [Smithella sp. PtaU1.Bin162]